MDSKEKILQDYGCPDIPFDEQVTMFYPAILQAMEQHARNHMIEFLKWYSASRGEGDTMWIEHIIDGFLNSEYLKDIQK